MTELEYLTTIRRDFGNQAATVASSWLSMKQLNAQVAEVTTDVIVRKVVHNYTTGHLRQLSGYLNVPPEQVKTIIALSAEIEVDSFLH
jgi:hypothetical protein